MMDLAVLKKKLVLHGMWLRGEEGGERADLRGANLCEADLCGVYLCEADLRGANLCEANLYGANLCEADLREANLYEANLRGADLRGANLCGANLCGANLCGADLRGANLCEADLRGANLRGANLRGARNVDQIKWDNDTAFFMLQCPESGSYTAYKKVGGRIVELEIPADAPRSSATTRKCRAGKALVLGITDLAGNPAGNSVASDYDAGFVYTVGERVEVPDFDLDRWHECAPGIHHYLTRGEAMRH